MEISEGEATELNSKTAFVKRALFGESNQALEAAIGNSLHELEQLAQLKIPEPVHQLAIENVENTVQDQRERHLMFICQKRHLVLGKIKKSAPLDVRDLSKKIGLKSGLFEFFWKRYFAGPTPLYLHTHPTLDKRTLTNNEFSGWDFGTGGKFDSEQTIKFFNMFAQFFSQGDLQNLEINLRHKRSIMLATSEGIIWLIKKRGKIPIIQEPTAKAARKYGKKMKEAMTRWGWAVADRVDEPMLESQVREDCYLALEKFCERNGMVAFANRDYKSNILKRIGA